MDIIALLVITAIIAGGVLWMASRPNRVLIVAGRRLSFEVVAEGDAFAARCLDVAVASDGPTEKEAVKNLREALALYFDAAERKP